MAADVGRASLHVSAHPAGCPTDRRARRRPAGPHVRDRRPAPRLPRPHARSRGRHAHRPDRRRGNQRRLRRPRRGPRVRQGRRRRHLRVRERVGGGRRRRPRSTRSCGPSGRALFIAQHRIREKSFLAERGLPVTPFAPVRSEDDLRAAIAQIGCPAVLKTASFGYDGKGQVPVAAAGRRAGRVGDARTPGGDPRSVHRSRSRDLGRRRARRRRRRRRTSRRSRTRTAITSSTSRWRRRPCRRQTARAGGRRDARGARSARLRRASCASSSSSRATAGC